MNIKNNFKGVSGGFIPLKPLNKKQVLNILTDTKAIQEGHFLLSSGYHSNKYVQCAKVLQHPKYCEELSKSIAEKFKNKKITLVIGPALGGITLAYEVARQLNCRGIFAERENNVMTIRRGFEIKENENVLVVEDVITTGGSVLEVINLVEKLGGKIVGIGCIVDRSEKIKFKQKIKSLVKLKIEKYSQKNCPLCKKNIPITKPGSKKF